MAQLVGIALVVLTVAGCYDGPSVASYVGWSPDGQLAYVRPSYSAGSWMVIDGAGDIVQPMAKHGDDRILGWMPDSRELVVTHQVAARSWREYAALLGPHRTTTVYALAALLSGFVHGYHGDWAKFGSSPGGESFGVVLYTTGIDLSQVVFYLEQTKPKLIAGLVAATKRAEHAKKPKTNKSGDSGPFISQDDLFPPRIIELRLHVAVDSGSAPDRVVTRSADAISWAQASPNGRAIAFSATQSEGPHVFVTALRAGAQPQQVDDNSSEHAALAAWSPDGQFLAYLASADVPGDGVDTKAFDRIYRRHVCDAAGDVIAKPDAETMLATLAPTSSPAIAWLPGDTLLFANETRPVVTGAPRKALFTLRMEPHGVPDVLTAQLQTENADYFVVSPDGERVALLNVNSGQVSIYTFKTHVLVAAQSPAFPTAGETRTLPSWKDANDLSYVVPAFSLPGESLRSDQVVLASVDGDKHVISQAWADTVGFLGNRYVVDIKDDVLTPSSLTIPINTTVTWMNNDGHPHALKGDDGQNGFDAKSIVAGAAFAVSFSKAGTFTYACSLHPSMRGTIVVIPLPHQGPASTK